MDLYTYNQATNSKFRDELNWIWERKPFLIYFIFGENPSKPDWLP